MLTSIIKKVILLNTFSNPEIKLLSYVVYMYTILTIG